MAGPAYFTAREPPQGTFDANVGADPVQVIPGGSIGVATSYDVSDWKGIRLSVTEDANPGAMTGSLAVHFAMINSTAYYELMPTLLHPYGADASNASLNNWTTNYVLDALESGSRFVRFVSTSGGGVATIYMSRIL
jgi:hypothetical protein